MDEAEVRCGWVAFGMDVSDEERDELSGDGAGDLLLGRRTEKGETN